MVIIHKYHDDDDLTQSPANDHPDAPPSYEDVSAGHSGQPIRLVDDKLAFPDTPRSSSFPGTSRVGAPSRPSSWLSKLSFTSSRTSKQVQQTVMALIRDLVLNAESPNLLSSCADACRNYGLDLSALLQEPSIENHSATYWAILNRRDTLLPSLLVHAAPLSKTTISDIRLACLTTSNQQLFQSLRCQREPFTKQMTPLSTSPGADALVLGSMPADEVSIREVEGQGAFVADLRINLWQKRMRVSGRVNVEFIARGRIWSLTFFSPPPAARAAVEMWQVALCLLEHSPPTFIDSRLVIDLPPSPSPSNTPTSPASASQTSDLISLSPPPDTSSPIARSSPPPSPPLSPRSKSKAKASRSIEVRLKNKNSYRLAYRASDTFLTALDVAFSSQKDWSPPHVERWADDSGITFTNAIIVPLDEGAGAELLYGNTPYIAIDGSLHVRLEARLAKPDATECVIC